MQVGLWANLRTITVGSITIQKYDLYSAEGYCFYIPANNLDENGDLIAEDERVYYRYMTSSYRTIDQINANIVSVPVQDGYEIVSTPNNSEVM